VDARTEADVVANLDRSRIEDHAQEVGVEAGADADVVPVVAMERRLDEGVLPCVAEQRLQQTCAPRIVDGIAAVESAQQLAAAQSLPRQLRV
jgi:hypothetical protein